MRVCEDDALDERGCGEDVVVACDDGEACLAGACVESTSCPDVGVECSDGDRTCAADDVLLECVLYARDGGGSCARFEPLADCAELGGVCDRPTRSCQIATCGGAERE